MVVEPFPDLARLVAELLQHASVACVQVATAEKALECARETKFDLLITELRLAGAMDGAALLTEWRAMGNHSPVIFISDFADYAPREKLALDDCCASVMQKPVNMDVFFQALEAAEARDHHANCVHRRADPVPPRLLS